MNQRPPWRSSSQGRAGGSFEDLPGFGCDARGAVHAPGCAACVFVTDFMAEVHLWGEVHDGPHDAIVVLEEVLPGRARHQLRFRFCCRLPGVGAMPGPRAARGVGPGGPIVLGAGSEISSSVFCFGELSFRGQVIGNLKRQLKLPLPRLARQWVSLSCAVSSFIHTRQKRSFMLVNSSHALTPATYHGSSATTMAGGRDITPPLRRTTSFGW